MEEFLSEKEAEYIQNTFRIPVDSFKPGPYWIISLDRDSFLPTDQELKQLRSYCEYKTATVYNEFWQKKLLEMPLAKCGGHNTTIFRKGIRHRPEETKGHWYFRKWSWSMGPLYMPSIMDGGYKALTLIEVMDIIEEIIPARWEEWKKKHSDIFG